MALTIQNDTMDGVYRTNDIVYKKENNREIVFTGSGNSEYIRLANNRNFTFALIPDTATTYKLQYTALEFKEGVIPQENDFVDSGLNETFSNGGNFTANMTGFRIVSNGSLKIQISSLR